MCLRVKLVKRKTAEAREAGGGEVKNGEYIARIDGVKAVARHWVGGIENIMGQPSREINVAFAPVV